MRRAEQATSTSRRDRILDAVEAVLWLALLAFGTAVAWEALREPGDADLAADDARFAIPADLIDAEDLPVRASSRDFVFWLQPTAGFRGGRWSKDGHMFAYDTREGDWIDLALPSGAAGPRRLELYMTRAPDYGIVAVSLNGERVGEPIDLWAYGIEPTGPVDLGIVQLAGEGDVLRLEVVGRNRAAAAPHFQFAIDGLRLGAP